MSPLCISAIAGAVAMAVAAQTLMNLGMFELEQYENRLSAYALERLHTVPGITIYGETDARSFHDRVGVIAFNLDSAHHALVAAILGYERGIGVRSGCFCAQPYVAHLLGFSETRRRGWEDDNSRRPGMVE